MNFVTSTSTRRRRRRRRNLLLVAAGVLAAASAAVVTLALASGGDEPVRNTSAGQTVSTTSSPTPEAVEAVEAVELRVADLMQQLGCTGDVIGTQLYSTETGRCTLGKHELTVAVFESDQLRDQWADAARQFGGNIAVGDGWAVWAETPDGAAAAAEKLGGQRR